jgi:hypothetical protein
MDVHSVTQERVRAHLRKFPSPLDAVIDRAKVEQAMAEEEEKASRRRERLRGAGYKAGVMTAITNEHERALKAQPTGGGGSSSTPQTSSARRRRYTMGDERERHPMQKAQIIGNTRSMSFHASTALFKGGRDQYHGSKRNFPHGMDPNGLRVAMGADLRTAALNAQLRDAREAKYDEDLRRMEEVASQCEGALERQVDGEKLRLGRIATPDQWLHSGELRRRGLIATWTWTPGFFVLCDGMLHEFAGAALSSPIVSAWPVLGGVARKGTPSSQNHPHVFELHLCSYFGEEPVLSVIELAAPTKEERKQWLAAIERASLRVSRVFRDTADKATHMSEVRERLRATPLPTARVSRSLTSARTRRCVVVSSFLTASCSCSRSRRWTCWRPEARSHLQRLKRRSLQGWPSSRAGR